MIERSVVEYGCLLVLLFVQHQQSPWFGSGKVACLITRLGVETRNDGQPRLFDSSKPCMRQIVLELRA